jgi:hypothetical protein
MARRITGSDVSMEKARQWGAARLTFIRWAGLIGAIWISNYPIKWLYLMARELAGKETKVSLGISIVVSVAGVATLIKIATGFNKAKKQTGELVRLRERCNILEKQVSDLQKLLAKKV